MSTKDETINDVTINDNTLTYFVCGDKYITTFDIDKSVDELHSYCDQLYTYIFQHYRCVKDSNTCGANCEELCRKLPHVGILYMMGAPAYSKSVQDVLEEVYGDQNTTMSISYHALAYIDMKGYFVAIEVSNHTPYHMQFYISNTQQGLYKLIKVRYNVRQITVTMNCDDRWMDVL